MEKYKHKLNYINWRKDAEHIQVDVEQMRDLLSRIKTTRTRITENITVRENWMKNPNLFYTKRVGNYLFLGFKENKKYYLYSTNFFDNNKNGRKNEDTGSEAIKKLSAKFKELNKVSFKKAFGYTGEEFKRCIPKQFVWRNSKYLCKKLDHVSSIDGCSQYPANICGLMPDYNTAVEHKGRIKPTKEYPFAFYLNSGHCAEYNRFDTHEWINSKFVMALFDPEKIRVVNDEDEITVLMKPSKYNFDETMNYFYNNKQKCDHESEEYKSAKLVMNASIGMMHTKRYCTYKMAHLVAIDIARSTQSILNMIDNIGSFFVLHVCVDGIMYLGKHSYGEPYKKLGVYTQEYSDCEGMIVNNNAYIIMKNNCVVKVKHGAYNSNSDGSIIDENKIKSVNEVLQWKKVDPLED